jgi:hypothetical protein
VRGGIAPYSVQMNTDLTTPNWVSIAGAINSTSLVIVPTNAAAFYQVEDQRGAGAGAAGLGGGYAEAACSEGRASPAPAQTGPGGGAWRMR